MATDKLKLLLALIIGCPLIVYCLQAPDLKPVELKPSDLQQLKLENLQLKAQLALQNFNQAQANYNQSVTALFQLCDEVKKENNWDKGVTCDPNTLKFSAPNKSGPSAIVGPSAAPPADSKSPSEKKVKP